MSPFLKFVSPWARINVGWKLKERSNDLIIKYRDKPKKKKQNIKESKNALELANY